jgi:hypothetical protein
VKKQDDYLKTALRLPRDLHARIHEAAEKAGRSMNAEIVARLEASFPSLTREPISAEDLREIVADLRALLEEKS